MKLGLSNHTHDLDGNCESASQKEGREARERNRRMNQEYGTHTHKHFKRGAHHGHEDNKILLGNLTVWKARYDRFHTESAGSSGVDF